MSELVALLAMDALKLVECSLEDKLTAVADEHLEQEVVEVVVMLSMMSPCL